MRDRRQVRYHPDAGQALDCLPFWVGLSARSYQRCTVKEDDVEVDVTDHDGFRVLTGRGTKSPIDFMRDSMFVPTYADELELYAHGGFLKAGRIIAHRLWKYSDIEYPVFLNGHSYGGAFMTVVALFMLRFGLKPAGLITQGCPRVISHAAARRLDQIPKRRMVVEHDLVPMVPFGLAYGHVGRAIRLSSATSFPLPNLASHRLAAYERGAELHFTESVHLRRPS